MKRLKNRLETITSVGLLSILAASACVEPPIGTQARSSAAASAASDKDKDKDKGDKDGDDKNDRNPAPFDPARAYRPDFDPRDMDTHIDLALSPMPVGAHWTYRSVTADGEEIIEIEVQPGVEPIGGTHARIVHDVARLNGELIEDTTDWFGQDDEDNVWYLGEATVKFTDGVGSDEGSWRTNVGGALPGIAMLARPKLDDAYRQEFLPGHAEDFAEVVALNRSVTVPAGSFHHCVQTRDQSTLDLALDELKTYCPGVGLVLTEEGETREELISYGGL